ncbi:glycoside hydrolase family 18 [Prevotella sp. kh1p2]|uniref:glycoside hydrolase family 18 n=1 Tax=Prevotella sp. kh1p2 TaxID=1761883 RepID=UPI0008AAED6D|nr:glycoside hydrolase family 18 [Prevotella sp. kh1p2]SES83957.1 Putative glycoside hydrolase Family 18, chitinase_18 [Prevotella sp. kh1p2]SNU10781.1 Putative glycoside hydrolase Family 18, chitinase_18 [Prevotellaceae bacterium KH2P17]
MKAIKYIMALVLAGGLMAACDTDVENREVQKPLTYDDLYYQNLRDYKASDHSISFMWFAQYGAQNSMAVRFAGLPDSLDICSLWGGIPAKENTKLWDELRFCQQKKGTKMLVVAITRIDAETDDHSFKQAYNEAKAMPEGEEREAALKKAVEMYADYFIDQVFENDLDGFDADYEPEGDFLSGNYFNEFMQHIALYMGPNPEQTKAERLKLIQQRYGNGVTDTDKLLCVDAPGSPSTELVPICDYYFKQAYGGGTSEGVWPIEKTVFCENVGDNWATALQGLINQAKFQPQQGRKGGFGAFFGHRNYNVTTYNPEPYKIFRDCIQYQNPAMH